MEKAPQEGEEGYGLYKYLSEQTNDGWRTIDTAPKDGSYILLYSVPYKRAYTDWLGLDGIGGGHPWARPSHWMPLPQKPKDI